MRRGEKEDVESISRAKRDTIRWCLHDVGILPIYWKWVEEVPADEILAHRIVWAFVLCYSY